MFENLKKNPIVEREEKILKFWRENRIFEKSLEKPSPKGEFIFYEGPPTANGKPGIHHLEARAFKDAIPRYKTMRGFSVRRKGGWDTHGLPVELAVEKALGLKSKKEIEAYGVEPFNKKCRESVWRYVKEWEEFTERMGYWIDLKRRYVTYKPYYIESVWNIVSKINERGLLYKDYKVVPWCPRCGTVLSSHELAQGYEDIKDLSVTVKFQITNPKSQTNSKSPACAEAASAGRQITNEDKTYLLAWTTTPWTLPGNVALAINPKTVYCKVKSVKSKVKSGEEIAGTFILAKNRIETVLKDYGYEIDKEFNGDELVGLEYEPLYPFLRDALRSDLSTDLRSDLGGRGSEKEKLKNAFKVYVADFVTTTDGTGIVHTAVMYGQDDFELGSKVGLPKYHLVNEDGTFKKEAGFLAGKFVKNEETDVEIIKDLAHRELLFAKEKYAHSYPHCWRCHTPLIYFARDSWYVAMSKLRDELVAENQEINWEPSYIKDGRFGEWLQDVKDWAISRERYWGTPLPVWECVSCGKKEVIGSFEKLFLRDGGKKLTRLVLVRHGESEKNILGLFDSSRDKYPLTKIGEKKAKEAGITLKKLGNVSAIYASPVLRTKQTAEIIGRELGLTPTFSDELWEVRSGEWDGKEGGIAAADADRIAYNNLPNEIYYKTARGKTGESWQQVENRVTEFTRQILEKHQGGTVVLVSHEGPLMMLIRYLKGFSLDEISNLWADSRVFYKGLLGGCAEPTEVYVDAQTGKEIDPHRPFIDDVTLLCECGAEMKRVKEVMDVWFDSGAMPFAQDADRRRRRETRINADGDNIVEDFWETISYPADFISEAIDQTRGWFYTLHAIGALMGKGKAYKNVICLGHILDAEGKKMSKSLGNVVDPNLMMEKYGADALRFWMYSVNQPGEPKNFDEKTVDEAVKKVFNLASNVLAFYLLYASSVNGQLSNVKSSNVLDGWILARLNQLIGEVTDGLEKYKLLEPTRAIRDFIADLSQWYLRRSRERIKSVVVEEKEAALSTLRFVLRELSKVMAPFAPFFAEHLYQELNTNTRMNANDANKKESVHLEKWPRTGGVDEQLLEEMTEVRRIVSLALEARAKANIKVRQPLAALKIRNPKSEIRNKSELFNLIKEEINVKEVIFDAEIQSDVELNTNITPELKEEGQFRELVRIVQDVRKRQGFKAGEFAILTVVATGISKRFIEQREQELARVASLKDIVIQDTAESSPSFSENMEQFHADEIILFLKLSHS